MNEFNLINLTRKLIELDDIDEAFNILDKFYEGKTIDEYTLLKSQWSSLKKNKRIGTINEEELNIRSNRIKLNILELPKRTIALSDLNIQNYLELDNEIEELDEKSILLLNLLLENLRAEELNPPNELIPLKTVSEWVEFDHPLTSVQTLFNNDLFEFLNNGEKLDYPHLRIKFITSLEKTINSSKSSRSSLSNEILENTLLQIVVENDHEKIKTEDVIDLFVNTSFLNSNYDIRDRIYRFIKDFGEAFTSGELSSKERLVDRDDLYGRFFSCFNKAFGTNDTNQINEITKVFAHKDKIKQIIEPTVIKILRKVNEKRQLDFSIAENRILKKQLKISNLGLKTWRYYLIAATSLSLLTLILLVCHFSNHKGLNNTVLINKEVNRMEIELEQIKDSMILLNNTADSFSLDFHNNKLIVDSLINDIKELDRQNKIIIQGIIELEKDIEYAKRK